MFTLVGYYDATAHAALAAIAAIADPHVRVMGNDIAVPELNRVLGVFAGGINMSQCRLQSPSLRRLANQRISPIAKQALPLARQAVDEGGAATYDVSETNPNLFYNDLRQDARILDVAESLNAYVINGGATAEWVLVWLFDKVEALPAGQIFSMEGSVSITGVLGAWVNGALTFLETLPAGRYAVVGMRVEDAAAVAGRLVIPASPWRPGVLGSEDTDTGDVYSHRFGWLGNWGEFEHDAPPTVDILANAAGAITPEVILDLVQVRPGRK